MKRALARLFCRHDWVKISVRQEIENNIRFGVREYRCLKCGKVSYQDSRCDRLSAVAVR